jgi:hypothetical protein
LKLAVDSSCDFISATVCRAAMGSPERVADTKRSRIGTGIPGPLPSTKFATATD